ncbi:hypothetical protein [Cellulosimicrobium funkei]|uniref:hypothetical protein n=1 Tax=Cellulosimicrobium funkei TaxID=264251 RepID=UPI003447DDB1
MSTPALDRSTEEMRTRFGAAWMTHDDARAAVSAALHDPDDPAWPLSALDPLPLPTNLRDWSPAMREAYWEASAEHGFTAGNKAAQRVLMIESAAKLRAALLGEAS